MHNFVHFGFISAIALANMLACGALEAAGPSCEIGTVIRAGALNYDAKIRKHDKARGLYQVEFVTASKAIENGFPRKV